MTAEEASDGLGLKWKPSTSYENLMNRGEKLLEELEAFNRFAGCVDTRNFKKFVETDLNFIEKVHRTSNFESEIDQNKLRSCNTPFGEALWDIAKRSTGIIALKRVYYPPGSRKSGVIVDVTSNNGLEWVKVSTITESNLLMQMAKEGWSAYDSDEDREESPSYGDDASDNSISIIRVTESLLKAANATRIRYRHPSVRLVLPRICRGRQSQIDTLLARIKGRGVIIQTADELRTPSPSLEESLPRMKVREFADFSETLNIDCTILLALVSDLSHGQVAANEGSRIWLHPFLRRQVEAEKRVQLLPTSLYPAMGSRSLVCTRTAANRMWGIVKTLGTDTEKTRAELLLDGLGEIAESWPIVDHRRVQHRLEHFRELSQYAVPQGWRIPIKVVDDITFNQTHPIANCLAHAQLDKMQEFPRVSNANLSNSLNLPALAPIVISRISGKTDINRSVFSYGWRTGYTTITSNRAVTKEIEQLVEEARLKTGEDDAVGPSIWLCGNARSLVGKEKTRMGAKDGV